MGVSLYFGLPGAGKTTIMSSIAFRECRKKAKKRKYKYVYGNVHFAIPGYTFIDNECVGAYDLSNSLILIDEATLFANSRDYKNFSKQLLSFMVQHRHYCCDIVFFSQRWDSLDLNIRVITDTVYYVRKGFLLPRIFTRYYKIPYGVIIPSKKKSDGEKLGEIVQGYCKPGFLGTLFCPLVYRPRYYKYFDSWEAPQLPPLPSRYTVFTCEKNLKKN